MIQWLNCNQGFVMGLLTLVYVGATIFLCIFNNKSAKAAATQLDEMKSSQEQNVKLQLFDKRYEIYDLLSDWHFIAETALSGTFTDPITNTLMPAHEVVELMLFSDTDNALLREVNDDIQRKTVSLGSAKRNEQSKIEAQIRELSTKRIMLGINLVFRESEKILTGKFIYPPDLSEKTESFIKAFVEMVVAKTDEALQELKIAYDEFEDAEILDKMKEHFTIR